MGARGSELGVVWTPGGRLDSAVLWPLSCSTKYVRGREAGEAVVTPIAFIANRNVQCILQLGVVRNG